MNRRAAAAAVVLVVLLVAVMWRARKTPNPSPSPTPAPSPVPSPSRSPSPAPRAPPPAAPVQLTKPPEVRAAAKPLSPGALQGFVIDGDTEQGIANAVITFSHDDGAEETTTVPGGAFRFEPRAAGVYRLVSLEAKGYLPFEGEFGRSPVSFTSVAGRDITGVVLRLTREPPHPHREPRTRAMQQKGAGSLRGRVTDARTGAPVAVFAVALWKRDGLRFAETVAPASFINLAGEYEIGGLEPGTYEATALAAGYAPSEYSVSQIADGPAQADFALRPGASISGMVRDATTSAPVAGADIAIEGRRGNAPDLPAAPSSPSAETGADGRFLLEHVPPDAMSLSVSKEGYITRLVPVSPDADSLDIRLAPRNGSKARVELTGIGATLRATSDALVIDSLLPGAGASDAGLAPGDQILSIDGVSVAKLGYEGSIGAIRGPEGTTVVLRIRRAGSDSDVVVPRKLVRG